MLRCLSSLRSVKCFKRTSSSRADFHCYHCRFDTADNVPRALCITLNSVVSIRMQRSFLSLFPPIKFSKMRSFGRLSRTFPSSYVSSSSSSRESLESTREAALRERHFNFPRQSNLHGKKKLTSFSRSLESTSSRCNTISSIKDSMRNSADAP